MINADEVTLQGWLDLQRVWFDNRNDPNMLKAGITDWQTRYPQNPGAKTLPSQLSNLQNFKPASANRIALLLPLNGRAAVFGRAIQQGFGSREKRCVCGFRPGSTATGGSGSNQPGSEPITNQRQRPDRRVCAARRCRARCATS